MKSNEPSFQALPMVPDVTKGSILYRLAWLITALVLTGSAVASAPDPHGARLQAESFFDLQFSSVHQSTNAAHPVAAFPNDKHAPRQVVSQRYQSAPGRKTPVFVFQQHQAGFVIIAQSKGQFAVVGYSPGGRFHTDSLPPQLETLLSIYEDSLTIINQSNAPKAQVVVAPLLSEAGVNLNQFGHKEAGGCPTGCVATAVAQIMAYYKFPSKGKGSHCYTHPKYGQLCADFENTGYNWNNPSANDYLKLSYHVGVAMDMDYCGSAFGSVPLAGFDRIQKHFGYYYHANTTASYYLRNELDMRRPVYITLPGRPGHAVVADGYDSNGLFHIHFGWGGSANGYYALNDNTTFRIGSYIFQSTVGSAYYFTPTILITDVQDSLALVAVHNSLNGTTGWDLSQPVFVWNGVLAMNGRIIGLYLKSGTTTLKGTLSPEIGKLTGLRRLILYGQLDGQLPSSISNLTGLQELIIDATQIVYQIDPPDNHGTQGNFKATLPDDIGRLSLLERLEIPDRAVGPIPASFGNLTQLRLLDLSNGELTGPLPVGFANFSNLEKIRLQNNRLSGTLPGDIGNLNRLTIFNISGNQFTGAIPASLGNCTNLVDLLLNDNQFGGALPAGIEHMTALEQLNVKNNLFNAMPQNLGKLKHLRLLDISTNQFTTLPQSIRELESLTELYAQKNRIVQPSKLFAVSNKLKHINLSNNLLTEFPEELCYAPRVLSIALSANRIERFPATLRMLSPTLHSLALDSNLIAGPIPAYLLTNPELPNVKLAYNRFTFEDLPDTSMIYTQPDGQQRVSLRKKQFKVGMGDTVRINIKHLTSFRRTGNKYYWCLYPKFYTTKDTSEVRNDSIFTVVITPKTIKNKYFCKVFNPTAPLYKFATPGTSVPAISFIATDTLSFVLATDEELIAEKYPGGHVVNSLGLPAKTVEDRIVTLVPPLKTRGALKWQASSDRITWHDVSASMAQNDLKANLLSIKNNELVLMPQTPAWYRCSLLDTDCELMYSDTILVNPFGKVLVDEMVNTDSASVIVKTDSLEITLPKGIHKGDFRITIVKPDNPPPAPDSVAMHSVYDVNLSFGDVFDIPLLIKFKNIPKNIDPMKKDSYQGVYYDDANQQWVKFDRAQFSLKDSCLNIITSHLTKLSKWYDKESVFWDFTDVYTCDKVTVYWKDKHEAIFTTSYEKQQTPQTWHITGIPVMIQDITHYLGEVLVKLDSLGLAVPDETVRVYVDELNGDDGVVGIMGMLNYYMSIDHIVDGGPIELRSLLAHEYMHILQDKYMVSGPGNIFWYEANAHLTDRMVWDESVIPVSQSDDYLMHSRTKAVSIFNSLGKSWDVWDHSILTQNLMGNIEYCYLAGSLIHYMRSYRNAAKLNLASLLTNVGWINSIMNWSWRSYLNQEVESQLQSTLGMEYEGFVKYILEGSNKHFTLLDLAGKSPFNHFIANAGTSGKGLFTTMKEYNFEKNNKQQKELISLPVDYLASKVIMLTNHTPNKNVIINYKRLHNFESSYKVYHCRYDLAENLIVFVDISNKAEYNLLLTPKNDLPEYVHQNIQFLLLVNTKCPTVIDNILDYTFFSRFEITATPVYDMTSFYYASIESKSKGLSIHNYSDGTKRSFIMEGASLGYGTGNVSNKVIEYKTFKTLTGPFSFMVNSSFESEERIDIIIPGYITWPLIRQISRTIDFSYNFLTGDLSMQTQTATTDLYERYIDGQLFLSKNFDMIESVSMDLQLISSFAPTADGLLLFNTGNSSETQSVVKSLKYSTVKQLFDLYTGEEKSEERRSYVSTDFSSGDVVIKILMNSE